DVREQDHPILVVGVALLDDQAGRADTLHDAHRLHHVDATVDHRDVFAHHLADGNVPDVFHSSVSTTSVNSSAWRTMPTASSTSICTAIPVPGLVSNSPTSAMCSRIRRLRCSSTSIRSTSRCAESAMPRKLTGLLRPSPRACVITVQPVARASRAASITAFVWRSSTNTTSSLKCMSTFSLEKSGQSARLLVLRRGQGAKALGAPLVLCVDLRVGK